MVIPRVGLLVEKSFFIEGTRVLRLPSDTQLVVVGDFPRQRAIKYVEHLAYAMVRKKLPVNFNVRKRQNCLHFQKCA